MTFGDGEEKEACLEGGVQDDKPPKMSSQWHYHVTFQLTLGLSCVVRGGLRGRLPYWISTMFVRSQVATSFLHTSPTPTIATQVFPGGRKLRFFRLGFKMFLKSRDNPTPRGDKGKSSHAETLNSFYFISFI